jgi:hypothetical protein
MRREKIKGRTEGKKEDESHKRRVRVIEMAGERGREEGRERKKK